MQVEQVAAKLFYCAFMILFISSFVEGAKHDLKRSIKYIAFGLIYYPMTLYFPVNQYSYMYYYTPLFFFLFGGTILERVTISVIAESVWCALSLISKIIFETSLENVVPSQSSRDILLDLICLIILSCVVRMVNRAAIFEQEIVKKRVSTVKQQLGMLVLAAEGDIVLEIAMRVKEKQMDLGPFFGTSFISFVLCLAGLYLVCFALSLDNSMAKEYYKVVNKTLETQIKSQYTYYQKLEQVTRETRAIKHDMKNHLIVMKGMAEKGDTKSVCEYLDNIQSSMDNVSVIIHTGNSIVDSIVNEKSEIAASKEIDMKVNIALQEDIDVPPMDLCVMVANTLDNAIEACDKIEAGKDKFISIYGRRERGYLSFIISNAVAKDVYISHNTIVTDKVDKLNHGYGLQNIRNSVKRNNGKLHIECKDLVFNLYIDIPISQGQDEKLSETI